MNLYQFFEQSSNDANNPIIQQIQQNRATKLNPQLSQCKLLLQRQTQNANFKQLSVKMSYNRVQPPPILQSSKAIQNLELQNLEKQQKHILRQRPWRYDHFYDEGTLKQKYAIDAQRYIHQINLENEEEHFYEAQIEIKDQNVSEESELFMLKADCTINIVQMNKMTALQKMQIKQNLGNVNFIYIEKDGKSAKYTLQNYLHSCQCKQLMQISLYRKKRLAEKEKQLKEALKQKPIKRSNSLLLKQISQQKSKLSLFDTPEQQSRFVMPNLQDNDDESSEIILDYEPIQNSSINQKAAPSRGFQLSTKESMVMTQNDLNKICGYTEIQPTNVQNAEEIIIFKDIDEFEAYIDTTYIKRFYNMKFNKNKITQGFSKIIQNNTKFCTLIKDDVCVLATDGITEHNPLKFSIKKHVPQKQMKGVKQKMLNFSSMVNSSMLTDYIDEELELNVDNFEIFE